MGIKMRMPHASAFALGSFLFVGNLKGKGGPKGRRMAHLGESTENKHTQ